MNRPIDIDFAIDVVCGHKGRGWAEDEPEQLVTRIVHRPRPDGPDVVRYGFLEWLEAEHPTADYPPALETHFGEAREHGRDRSPGMGATLWNFWCRTCEIRAPFRGDRLNPVLDRLHQAGERRVTLALLIDVLG